LSRLPVRWSREASLDLIEIVEFVGQDQPSAARKLGRAILAAASRLKQNPRRGKVVPELWEQGISDYRQLTISAYRIIFSVRADSVGILAVVDSRRDLHLALFQRLIRS